MVGVSVTVAVGEAGMAVFVGGGLGEAVLTGAVVGDGGWMVGSKVFVA
jgi:hypothetical protein